MQFESFSYNEAKEKKGVAKLVKACELLWNALYDLTRLTEFQQRLTPQSRRHIALGGLMARQVALLDAAQAAANVGRAGAVDMLVRAMYETWLCMLAIAYYKDTLRGISPDTLGERYMQHLLFHQALKAQAIKQHALRSLRQRGENVRAGRKFLDSLIAEGMAHKPTFKNEKTPWHPFGGSYAGVQQLHDHLWPKGRPRKFPKKAFPDSRAKWDEAYQLYWKGGSNDVHAAGNSITRFMPRNSGALINHQRRFEAAGLHNAIFFAGTSIQIVAMEAGLESEWDITSQAAFALLGP